MRDLGVPSSLPAGTSKTIYTIWGDERCPQPAIFLFNGTAVTVDGKYPICLSTIQRNPDLVGFENGEDNLDIMYIIHDRKIVRCALCLLDGIPNTITVPEILGDYGNKKNCPSGWKEEYEGHFMTNNFHPGMKSICVTTIESCDDDGASDLDDNNDACEIPKRDDNHDISQRWNMSPLKCTVCSKVDLFYIL